MDDLPQDEVTALESKLNRRQLIVVVNEHGELEIEGDPFAAWELVGIGAFVLQVGEDELVSVAEDEPEE